jgi:2-dehydro-3-deoxygluconokinase
VTALPDNAIGDACLAALRGLGIGTRHVLRSGDRLGVYYLEGGSNQRPSRVIYDRAGSSFAETDPQQFDWPRIFDGAGWFHVTGITPALGAKPAEAALAAARAARSLGLTVSCDYNYRKNLWNWGRTARDVMTELVLSCDIGIANEEDCQKALGIPFASADRSSPEAGRLQVDDYRRLTSDVLRAFPGLRKQAITLRESRSADRNGWSACLDNRDDFLAGTLYEVQDVVDRVGTGDAFAAGLIRSWVNGLGDRQALEFAVAASCLKHTIPGDVNRSSVAEVEQLLREGGAGRIQR